MEFLAVNSQINITKIGNQLTMLECLVAAVM